MACVQVDGDGNVIWRSADPVAATEELSQLTGPLSSDSNFTIALIPDPQVMTSYAGAGRTAFEGLIGAIIDRKTAGENIQAVMCTGDMADLATAVSDEFSYIKTQLDLLIAAGIPFYPAVGNHDYNDNTISDARTLTRFNAVFSSSFITTGAVTCYNGTTLDNYYVIRTIGTQSYMILSLEPFPRDAVVTWAAAAVAAHPECKVLIQTHSYIGVDGRLVADADKYGPTTYSVTGVNNGDELFANLIGKYSNVMLTVSGHDLPYGVNCVRYRADVGINGNIINNIFANYQEADRYTRWNATTHVLGANSSGGLFAGVGLLRVSPANGTITADFYSTIGQALYADPYTPTAVLYTTAPKMPMSLALLGDLAVKRQLMVGGNADIYGELSILPGPRTGIQRIRFMQSDYAYGDNNLPAVASIPQNEWSFRYKNSSRHCYINAPNDGGLNVNFDHGTGGFFVFDGTVNHLQLLGVVGTSITGPEFRTRIEALTGGHGVKAVTATATLPTSGTAATTITLSIPRGVRIVGCQLRINTAVTGASALTCAYTAGVATPSITNSLDGTATLGVAKNDKMNHMHPVHELTTATTNITVTPTGTYSGTAGVVCAVVYYETLTALSNAT